MTGRSLCWLCLAFTLNLPLVAHADLYAKLDEDGKSHLSKTPLPGYDIVIRGEVKPGRIKAVIVPGKGAVVVDGNRPARTAARSTAPAKRSRGTTRVVSVRSSAPVKVSAPGGLGAIIQAEARRSGISPHLVQAVIATESSFNVRAVSPKGAVGLMQLMPDTARRFGVSNRYDPAQNIKAGSRYLRWLIDRYGGNVRLALAAYNAGEGTVARYGNRIPPYFETQTYVQKVLRRYEALSG